jgi:hypothetical protein
VSEPPVVFTFVESTVAFINLTEPSAPPVTPCSSSSVNSFSTLGRSSISILLFSSVCSPRRCLVHWVALKCLKRNGTDPSLLSVVLGFRHLQYGKPQRRQLYLCRLSHPRCFSRSHRPLIRACLLRWCPPPITPFSASAVRSSTALGRSSISILNIRRSVLLLLLHLLRRKWRKKTIIIRKLF